MEDAPPTCFIVFPSSEVLVAIDMTESAIAISFTLGPLTLVLGTVGPVHGTDTVSEATEPLAGELGTSFVGKSCAEFFFLTGVEEA